VDRRRLILASSALIPGIVIPGLVLSGAAMAQTQLPPARSAQQDGPPPPSEEYPQDNRPAPRQAPSPRYQDNTVPPVESAQPSYAAAPKAETYSREELVNSVSDFLGVTAEAAGSAIEHIFRDNGRPTGYIAGEEGSGAFIGGVRYGKGLLYMKGRPPVTVYWQGPSIGFDWGGNASRNFTLCYNLQYPDAVYRRFPGVEGTAYLVGGLGVNYQRAEDIVLAPIRAGVGLRLGANIGYLSYSRQRHWIPL
jgi:hypothetical protein